MSATRLRAWRGRLLALVALLLVACGGGGGMLASGGIVGTGDGAVIARGVMTAASPTSITVNGIAFDVRLASVSVDGRPGSLDALQVGMVVAVEGVAQPGGAVAAQRVEYRADLRGVVDGTDSALRAFTALGQQVRTDANTVFAGGTFATLRNQWVEVSGLRGREGELLATWVGISAAPTAALAQVAGVVVALDPAARTFRVGTVLVDYAAVAAPSGLRDGAAVIVSGMLSPTGERLAASAIAIVATSTAAEGARVGVEGLVTGFVSLARFDVDGRPVDASSATITGGAPAAIVDGARVEVEGRLRGGVIVATRVEIEEVPTIAVEGLVDAVGVAASTVTVAGQVFSVVPATQFVDASSQPVAGFGLDRIAIGDRVAVRAQRMASGLVASRIERRDRAAPPAGTSTRVTGVVSGFVSPSAFVVGTQRVNAASARFEQGTASDLRDGVRVEAEGIVSGEILLATRVAFVPDPGVPTAEVEIDGAISGFASVARFRVAGQVVDASSARFVNGTGATLADGRVVTVRGVLVAGVVQASLVTFRSDPPPTTVELEGAVTDYVSIADFRVEGQRVDASAARFSGGTAASVRNGRRVHVAGALVGGVVRAASVAIEDDTSGVEASVEGRITAFVSVANFTVAGRVVDASGATFENGTAAGLRVGRVVHVEGRLAGTVLRASKVSLE